jgi:hypothetical protein
MIKWFVFRQKCKESRQAATNRTRLGKKCSKVGEKFPKVGEIFSSHSPMVYVCAYQRTDEWQKE